MTAPDIRTLPPDIRALPLEGGALHRAELGGNHTVHVDVDLVGYRTIWMRRIFGHYRRISGNNFLKAKCSSIQNWGAIKLFKSMESRTNAGYPVAAPDIRTLPPDIRSLPLEGGALHRAELGGNHAVHVDVDLG